MKQTCFWTKQVNSLTKKKKMLYKNIIFGILTNEKLKDILDLDTREKIILYPLIALVIFIGIFPNIFLDPMRLSI